MVLIIAVVALGLALLVMYRTSDAPIGGAPTGMPNSKGGSPSTPKGKATAKADAKSEATGAKQ